MCSTEVFRQRTRELCLGQTCGRKMVRPFIRTLDPILISAIAHNFYKSRSEPTSKMERRQLWHHILATDCFIDCHAPFVRVLERKFQKGCRSMPQLQAERSAVPLRIVLKVEIVSLFSSLTGRLSVILAREGLDMSRGASSGSERNRLPPGERKTDRISAHERGSKGVQRYSIENTRIDSCKVFQSCEKQAGYLFHA